MPFRVHAHQVTERWLRLVFATVRKQPKKLAIFDFDGTLFRSPLPAEDLENPETWWANPKSLTPPLVPEEPGEEMWHPITLDAFRQASEDPQTYVVVMTGRHNSLQDRIQELLDGAGLKPDELITNPNIGNTMQAKRDEMLYLLRQFPLIREVEFWEDTKDALKGYQRAGEKAGVKFTPRLVKNYEKEPPPFFGVFLPPEVRRQLLRDVPPAHSEVEADHVTLKFKPTQEQAEEFRSQFQLGQRFPLKVTGIVQDDKAQAITLELPEALKQVSERTPHITISTAPGVDPAYSNELLARGQVKPIAPKSYTGYLDVGPRMSPPSSKQQKKPSPQQKQELWDEFLKATVPNPNYGKPGHRKKEVQRKTLYDSGDKQLRQRLMRDWDSFVSRQPAS